MRDPKAWQKFTAAFKKPFQKLFKRKPIAKPTDDDFFRESGESVYHKMKGERKLKKRKKRVENKSRAVNAKINKTWKK